MVTAWTVNEIDEQSFSYKNKYLRMDKLKMIGTSKFIHFVDYGLFSGTTLSLDC